MDMKTAFKRNKGQNIFIDAFVPFEAKANMFQTL